MKKIRLLIISLFIFAMNSFTLAQSLITFQIDDYYFETFYNHYDYIQSNGIKMTYYVTKYPVLSAYRLTLLDIFNSDDHEVAFHGSQHISSVLYVMNHTVEDYMDYEIYPALNLMIAEGYDVTNFSYPYGKHNELTDSLCFNIFYFIKLGTTRLYLYDTIEEPQIIHPLPIDNNYSITETQIFNYIKEADDSNKVISIYAHQLIDSKAPKVTFDRFQRVFDTLTTRNFNYIRLDKLEDQYYFSK